MFYSLLFYLVLVDLLFGVDAICLIVLLVFFFILILLFVDIVVVCFLGFGCFRLWFMFTDALWFILCFDVLLVMVALLLVGWFVIVFSLVVVWLVVMVVCLLLRCFIGCFRLIYLVYVCCVVYCCLSLVCCYFVVF